MKKQILSIALGLIMMAIGTTTSALDKNFDSGTEFTNKKVIKDFDKNFKTLSNAGTSPSNGSHIVNSLVDGHEIISVYNRKSKLIYTITRYATDNLAKNIMDIVRENYDTYFISGMEKVDQPGNESVFIVHIKNRDSFKTLRVVNSEVELVQDFQNG